MVYNSDRLIFKKFKVTDASYLFALNADPKVLKYTGDIPFKSIKETQEFILNYQSVYTEHGMGRWSVLIASTQEYIGWCGLKRQDDGQVNIGYRWMAKYWNNGYATEASLRTLKYGFDVLHLPKIIARTHVQNLASLKVIQKCGMIYENDFVENGQQWKQFGLKNPDDDS